MRKKKKLRIGGCWMIGSSPNVSKHFMEKVMKDNPQGQGDELTPFCIVCIINVIASRILEFYSGFVLFVSPNSGNACFSYLECYS